MENMDTFGQVREIVAKQLGVNEERITMDSAFIEDLGADSLDTVELVMALEEKFGLEIPDDDVEKMRTVGDVVNYIEKRKQ